MLMEIHDLCGHFIKRPFYTFKWLNRRSQRRSFDWDKFKRQLKINKVPMPKPTEKRLLNRVTLR